MKPPSVAHIEAMRGTHLPQLHAWLERQREIDEESDKLLQEKWEALRDRLLARAELTMREIEYWSAQRAVANLTE